MSLDVKEAYIAGYEEAMSQVMLFLLDLQEHAGDRHNYYIYAARKLEEHVVVYLSKLTTQEH